MARLLLNDMAALDSEPRFFECDNINNRVFYLEDGESYDYNNPGWEGTDTTCTILNLDDNIEFC